ncbi:flagellin [Tropicibacter naphthalenivorans]|uniref:Flagellin n=1 Tax=Tropicibacter naphthalenivorans TaxID=441103 RepID=A0A0P1G406_9RHOB|nr:flagellin [Tropicibacter naphthalenivorans]CUH76551.1 Flagellin [Tropicibacter naphthalenivorans]SMC65420.1 flagellin [Tropicibacter naphthalenivorans]
MSSILTNRGATVALQTLRSINDQLSTVQTEISTGRKVSQPGDNSAVWAISKTMEADVRGFKGVSDSLNLGQSTVSVARQGAETISELLTEVKGKVVAAQESNVDRNKIQADIEALTEQIGSIVNAASFNGQNLLKNSDTEAGSGDIDVLASINRSPTGVTTSDINIDKIDLGINEGSVAATGGTFAAAAATGTVNATQSVDIDVSGLTVETGTAFSLQIFGTDGDNSSFTAADYQSTAAAAQTQAEMAAGDMTYVARDGDTMEDVVYALGKKWEAYAQGNGLSSDVLDLDFKGSTITASSNVTDGTDSIAVNVSTISADAGNTIAGGLADLASMDVTSDAGASKALGQVEALLGIAVDAAASFGSDERRLQTQNDFISGLSDSLKSGIGTLVDTDMEEASAKLQALQVQQQLAMQSLSIANSQPQSMLALFR